MTGPVVAPVAWDPGRTADTADRLMARVAAGDREAFAELVETHKDDLVAYLYRLSGHRQTAEDLAQETFLRLYRAAGRYRARGMFRAYLYRIATHLVRSAERRGRLLRFVPLAAASAARSPLPGPEVQAEKGQALSRVARALADLPLKYRAPLVLRAVEGWSIEEIGQALSLPAGTVKSRISRARRRLRERLENEADPGREPR
ncbi:MAG: RNA polymerase sigma factor [Acidobacteriota bacterium]|nr:RNA polymerase sigma factor [Acidobacteriota bacterium]MDQ7087558.1 RNA polymerase sigma factor [Acidobacteriota bacterium]